MKPIAAVLAADLTLTAFEAPDVPDLTTNHVAATLPTAGRNWTFLTRLLSFIIVASVGMAISMATGW